jgi:hypothetical protein
VPESFVCNIGDMLDRMTGGLYRSTPHRVALNRSGRHRLSFPLFFDPDFDVRIEPIRHAEVDDSAARWDGASVHAFDGTYGDYVMGKVGKVFGCGPGCCGNLPPSARAMRRPSCPRSQFGRFDDPTPGRGCCRPAMPDHGRALIGLARASAPRALGHGNAFARCAAAGPAPRSCRSAATAAR